MRSILLSLAVAVAACSSPPSKENNANGTPNNVNGTANSTSNNANSATNSATNGTTGRDIWAADYDQTCDYDGDCTVVHEGDACLCGGAACGNAGINHNDLEAWSAEREALCAPEDQICSGAPCFEILPVCTSNGCDAREPVYVDPSGLDTSCEVDEDCTIIVSGELCSSCKCGGTPVNAAAADEYLATLPEVDCRPGPDFCDCAILGESYCDGGTCQPGVRP